MTTRIGIGAAALSSLMGKDATAAPGPRVGGLPGLPHFDPYPFTFLTLCVSLEAIFLSSFILIAQNYEMRVTERRSQLDQHFNRRVARPTLNVADVGAVDPGLEGVVFLAPAFGSAQAL